MPYNNDELTLSGPVTIDLTDVSTDPVAEGWHSVEVTEIGMSLSSNKHNPQIDVQMKVIDEMDPEEGRMLFAHLQLAGGGKVFTKLFFEAVNFDISEAVEITADALGDELVGKRLDVKVKHNPAPNDPDTIFANTNGYEPYGSRAGGFDGAGDLGLDLE